MDTKQDHSYGVVPLHKNEAGEWEVFILHQLSRRQDTYWTFPKGHPEEGETPAATALRELKEEAGLTATLDDSVTFSQSYVFEHENTLIEKSVTYYIGYVEQTDFTLQPEEVTEARWCTFTEAMSTLTHENAKRTLREVIHHVTAV